MFVKRKNLTLFLLLSVLLFTLRSMAEDVWPKTIESDQLKIVIYQPDPESLEGNVLHARSVVAVTSNGSANPVFGVIWADATLDIDRNSRMATMESMNVTDVRFPGKPDTAQQAQLETMIAQEVPKWNLEISMDELATTLSDAKLENKESSQLNNTPPKILYSNVPATLVLIEGDPKLESIENTQLQRVVNTPYILLYSPSEKRYYLNGAGLWFVTSDINSGWKQTDQLSPEMQSVATQLVKQGTIISPDSADRTIIPQIIVSRDPAELIQTDGDPQLSSVKGTVLTYVTNSDNQLFMDVTNQQYYVLLSGRWFTSKSLKNGQWTYVASTELPADFAKIPVGSDKDVVLASVGGTTQAKDAVLDAQLPQTATVDRATASASVTYDGDPQFDQIQGSDGLSYAKNSTEPVLMQNQTYYCVSNGVWFQSNSPNGPWVVCTQRPAGVDNIPPSYPVYNVKYVYIYDYTPGVVYVGYTPGYTNCYIYGPTVVYGTGYYYHPWYGTYFYPRPVTWGFNMTYNPWTGWGFGASYSVGWFSYGWHTHGYYGGYWGPYGYRPAVHIHYNNYYGYRPAPYYNTYYGRRNYAPPYYKTHYAQPYRYPNNMYSNRPGVTTRPAPVRPTNPGNTRPGGTTRPTPLPSAPGNNTRPSPSQPGGGNTTRPVPQPSKDNKLPSNDKIISDPNGNIYKNKGKDWQQYDNGKWQRPQTQPTNTVQPRPSSPNNQVNPGNSKPAQRPDQQYNPQQMQREMQDRQRGEVRQQNFNQYQNNSSRQQGNPKRK